jgi:hypothetical protein
MNRKNWILSGLVFSAFAGLHLGLRWGFPSLQGLGLALFLGAVLVLFFGR